MKSLQRICFLFFLPVFTMAQSPHAELDSLRRAVQQAKNDTIRMFALNDLGFYYDDVNMDSAVYYCEKAITIARLKQLRIDEANFYTTISWPLNKMGNYPRSLKLLNQALDIASNPASEKYYYNIPKGKTPQSMRLNLLGWVHVCIAGLFGYTGSNDKAIVELNEAKKITEYSKNTQELGDLYSIMGSTYLKLNKPDSALFFNQQALIYSYKWTYKKFQAMIFLQIGESYLQKGDTTKAKENFEKAIQVSTLYNNPARNGEGHLQLARLFQSQNKIDSSLYHSQEALAILKLVGKEKSTASAYRMISDYYWKLGKPDSSFAYLRLATVLNDKLDKAERVKIQEFQVAGFEEALKLEELEKGKIKTESALRTYGMLAGLAILSIIGFILYRNNRQKQKANAVLETTLSNLQSTQSQLIQSEKMASLGELTAGIAHEIQNPLNFVNNFSEVNKELLVEMKEEMEKGNLKDAKGIANDIIANEEKINHHGKRADAIVKGMLLHSQVNTGQKEATNINALADEYLRLAYHGLKAKDKSFNASMKTGFDPQMGTINIVPQDIGRVLLNLYNNAFYAVSEKQKFSIEGYEPTISVRTKKINGELEITIGDNGNGIPEKALEKVFQPFFTTKPTGQGTGLGLSLSYDIIKAHQGKISIKNKPGAGAEFIITIPINS